MDTVTGEPHLERHFLATVVSISSVVFLARSLHMHVQLRLGFHYIPSDPDWSPSVRLDSLTAVNGGSYLSGYRIISLVEPA
jgi:hypothetical protein